MLYTPHFLTGAAIIKLFPDLRIGLPLALLSHFILDYIPHNDFDLRPGVTVKEIFTYPPKRKYFIFGTMALDGLIMLGCFFWMLFILGKPAWIVGGLVGILPDISEQSFMLMGKNLPGLQDKFQWRVSARYGFISYPVVSILAVYILLH